MKVADLKAPFPYFGGKRRVAHLVWPRFGDTLNYVEPFAGSLAVLLSRPYEPRTETVNDIDAYLSNFWRAVVADPNAVAMYADWPVNEADLHARHLWLVNQADFRKRMMTDPEYYDPKIAGWWVWGISAWIGSGWCDVSKTPSRQVPFIGGGSNNTGQGIHKATMTRNGRSRPNLRPAQGVEAVSLQIPHVGDHGRGIHAPSRQRQELKRGKGVNGQLPSGIYDYMQALQQRLRRVRVVCGDWQRVTGKSVTWKIGTTAVFLDPPYNTDANRANGLYANDDLQVSTAVREWALAEGDNPKMRIALCGYEDEHGPHMPDTWECIAWKANGGYSNQNSAGNDNASKERIWFSPHCLKVGDNLRNYWM
jgi:hypothetical protein